MDFQQIIESLSLEPHPEGGYYRQVYHNGSQHGNSVSSIYYLLAGQDFSAFHRLHGMTEIWYYHAGEGLNIYVLNADGSITIHHLSSDNEMQVVIPPEQWFSAELTAKEGFCLVGCAVSPAFSFDNFELGKKDELTKQFPKHESLIRRLCRK